MTRYESPNPDTINTVRFLRLRGEIFLGRSIHDKHKDIARMDQIDEAIESARIAEPTQVDGGFADFLPGVIKIALNSDSMDLPVPEYAEETRKITIKCFQEQSPNHRVMAAKELF